MRVRRQQGFTLIELMVAIGILALVAMLSWRGLDAMVRAQQGTQTRSDRIAVLQTALAQWRVDLDAVLPPGQAQSSTLDWNGQTLRLLRLASADAATSGSKQGAGEAPPLLAPGTIVVAWTLRNTCPSNSPDMPARSCWMRWQSPVLHTMGEQQQAWQQAAGWGSGSQGDAAGQQVMLPLTSWTLQVYRDDAWGPFTAAAGVAAGGTSGQPAASQTLPDGLRLQLVLPGDGGGLAGTLVQDWLQPTLTRERS